MTDQDPQQNHEDRVSKRIGTVGVVMTGLLGLGMLGLGGRLWWLTQNVDPRLQAIAESHYRVDRQVARRGDIVDREGRVFAGSRVAWRLFTDPSLIEDMDTFAQDVAAALDLDPAEIDMRLGMARSRRFVVLKDMLNEAEAEKVRALDRRSLGLDKIVIREYPQGATAGQVIGFTGTEHRGMDGLEYRFEEVLSSQVGREAYLVDSGRRALELKDSGQIKAQDGQTVQLTIDLQIQKFAEAAVRESCERYGAKRGNAVVLDARTGEVLALVNWPPYDPAQGGNIPVDQRRNHSVTDTFEPGSIFKPLIYGLALNEKVTWPTEMIDCTTGGAKRYDFGRTLRDSHPVGRVTSDKVLIKSSNIGMAEFGLRLGKNRLRNGMLAFGIGQRTDIGLAGEASGLVTSPRNWNLYTTTSVTMGHEVAVTPLQIASAFSVFANEGRLIRPKLFMNPQQEARGQQVLKPEVAAHLRQVMRRVVTEGTGRRSKSSKYRIWGKTGTAQVPRTDGRGYVPDGYRGSFVCGAPLDDPRIIVAVHIHEPERSKGYYGGIVAGPYAKQIVENTLEYMGVPHDAHLDDEDASSTRLARH